VREVKQELEGKVLALLPEVVLHSLEELGGQCRRSADVNSIVNSEQPAAASLLPLPLARATTFRWR
jgi:hypothetical protein